MTPAEERLAAHLADDERVRGLTSGRLLEAGSSYRLTVGVTDRRVLWVSKTETFASIGVEHVSSVRTRPRVGWTYRYRPDDAVLAGLVGSLLALSIAIVGIGLGSTGPRGVLLATVLGAVAAVAVTSVLYGRRTPELDRAARQLLVGTGVLAVASASAAAVAVSSVPPSLFALAAVGCTVVATQGPRYLASIDGVGVSRRRETQLTITTVDGETIHLAVDAGTAFERTLSRSCSASEPPAPTTLAVSK